LQLLIGVSLAREKTISLQVTDRLLYLLKLCTSMLNPSFNKIQILIFLDKNFYLIIVNKISSGLCSLQMMTKKEELRRPLRLDEE